MRNWESIDSRIPAAERRQHKASGASPRKAITASLPSCGAATDELASEDVLLPQWMTASRSQTMCSSSNRYFSSKQPSKFVFERPLTWCDEVSAVFRAVDDGISCCRRYGTKDWCMSLPFADYSRSVAAPQLDAVGPSPTSGLRPRLYAVAAPRLFGNHLIPSLLNDVGWKPIPQHFVPSVSRVFDHLRRDPSGFAGCSVT